MGGRAGAPLQGKATSWDPLRRCVGRDVSGATDILWVAERLCCSQGSGTLAQA